MSLHDPPPPSIRPATSPPRCSHSRRPADISTPYAPSSGRKHRRGHPAAECAGRGRLAGVGPKPGDCLPIPLRCTDCKSCALCTLTARPRPSSMLQATFSLRTRDAGLHRRHRRGSPADRRLRRQSGRDRRLVPAGEHCRDLLGHPHRPAARGPDCDRQLPRPLHRDLAGERPDGAAAGRRGAHRLSHALQRRPDGRLRPALFADRHDHRPDRARSRRSSLPSAGRLSRT